MYNRLAIAQTIVESSSSIFLRKASTWRKQKTCKRPLFIIQPLTSWQESNCPQGFTNWWHPTCLDLMVFIRKTCSQSDPTSSLDDSCATDITSVVSAIISASSTKWRSVIQINPNDIPQLRFSDILPSAWYIQLLSSVEVRTHLWRTTVLIEKQFVIVPSYQNTGRISDWLALAVFRQRPEFSWK